MNSKQRAYLRGLANNIPSILQVGKSGINENLIIQVKDALEARELIKITLLENSLLDLKEVANEVAEKTESETIQVIGNKFVLYKKSINNPLIVLP
jgi:RNA-binding protein